MWCLAYFLFERVIESIGNLEVLVLPILRNRFDDSEKNLASSD